MLIIRQSARRLSSRLLRQPPRRYESITGRQDTSTGHFDSAGQHSGSPPPPPHPEPVNESLGRGFYVTLALVPLSFALYKFSRSSNPNVSDPNAKEQPWLTRIIASYDHWGKEWERRNSLHTVMIEQAAHDRHLFQGEAFNEKKQPGVRVELRFPEIFSTGSPYNVPAGHQANLDELIEHYRKRNVEAQEKRERKAQAIYEGRENELSRWADESQIKPSEIPGSSTY
ncbi:MAG: hypothetical protein Q9191_006052 [Dirinaria sp. TL-2023a]